VRLVLALAFLFTFPSCTRCTPKQTMDTVLWWEEDDAGRPVRFLAVGPGSPPRSREMWAYSSFDGRPAPERWAHLNITSAKGLSQATRDAVASGPTRGDGRLQQLVFAPDDQVRGHFEHVDMAASGFLACQQEARAHLAERLAQSLVASDPDHAGVWLARLRRVQGHVALDTAPVAAPAADQAAGPVRAFRFAHPRFGVGLEGGAVTWCEGEVEAAARTRHHVVPMQLDSEPPAELPTTTWEWPVTITDGPSACQWQQGELHVTRPPGEIGHIVVELRVLLHGCPWKHPCDTWPDRAIGVPVGIMTLRAPLLP
jgi:hypothetical protein